jgi:hypothetical protein
VRAEGGLSDGRLGVLLQFDMIVYMPQPEARLVAKIQKFLEDKKARSFKIHGEDTFQEVGIPDLLVCYRGRFIGLEVKLQGGRPSPIQAAVLRQIVEAGGYASVASTVGQVANLLAIIDREVDVAASPTDLLERRRSILHHSIHRTTTGKVKLP